MAADRYLRVVATVIACALVYLCFVMTPGPAAHAQQPTLRPGEPSGPVEVLVVGWQPGLPALPVVVGAPVSVEGLVQVSGTVQTEQGVGRADRVVLVGWEERTTETPGRFRWLDPAEPGVPVTPSPGGR